jgi:hypothetical protein
LSLLSEYSTRHGLDEPLLSVAPCFAFLNITRLQRFYWEGYLIVKKRAPYWKYLMHDSFRLDPKIWGGFMDGCPERALDTHIYQAWRNPDSRIGYYTDACSQKRSIAAMERAFGPVIVGEWSLATDNCAMWLNGFNDNVRAYVVPVHLVDGFIIPSNSSLLSVVCSYPAFLDCRANIKYAPSRTWKMTRTTMSMKQLHPCSQVYQ